MPSRDHILGVVLAGGRSRRFGSEKAFGDLAGEPVIAHVIARFRPQVGRLILNANGDLTRFASFGLETIPDDESPELGPLSGLLAAFDWAAHNMAGCIAVATVSADVPFLPLDLVERLDEARGGQTALAISGERRHPTIALWPMSARPAVAGALKRRTLGVDALASDLNAIAVAFPMRDIDGRMLDPFFNVNTPDDLAAARTLITKA
jgi:molybdopterin-guanine dinucleotide biosynthesis protein A